MHKPPFAVIDACVLYSATLRDLIMWLTIRLVFQPKWTDEIHEEWIENLLINRPDLNRAKLERTRDLMNRWGRDWRVKGYSRLIDTLNLPDPDDRHVLAAAVAASVDTIVTFNISDFPMSVLEPLSIRSVHPDSFFCELFDKASDLFLLAIHDQLDALKKPPHTLDDLLQKLRQEHMPQLCDRIEGHRNEF